jgi:hypothetical protein
MNQIKKLLLLSIYNSLGCFSGVFWAVLLDAAVQFGCLIFFF